MCGIVGYVGQREAVGFLTAALRRLEYRGYDSAGLATLNGHGLEICKVRGKIANLEAAVLTRPPSGRVGIAHTRWATHGKPSEINAHPHVDCKNRIAVVHNGIIENHRELRQRLIASGHTFRSETDTEVIAHLIEEYAGLGLTEAARRAAADLRGAYAIACISEDSPNTIVAFRGGSSPLVLGVNDGEIFLASDMPALLGRTTEAVILADGEMAVLTQTGVSIQTTDGRSVTRTPTAIIGEQGAVEKSGYAHFMLKEVYEQPDAIRHTLLERADLASGRIDLSHGGLTEAELASVKRVAFVACGTSWHAGLLGHYLVEDLARVPASADLASELRHRRPVVEDGLLVVPISQSGETADTLAAVRSLRANGARAFAVCNVVGSSLTRESDAVLYTRAGIEIGVAATKSFTTQVTAALLLALGLAQARKTMTRDEIRGLVAALHQAPALIEEMLAGSDRIRVIAERFLERRSCLYLGRGLQYPLALEGALKLKELSYIHAEGYAAGEMKHGPIALIEDGTPVVVLAPAGPTLSNIVSNIQEVKARDGAVIAIATSGDEAVASLADAFIPLPPAHPVIQPLLAAIPLQLLAYHVAVLRGCDADQPRNLAKSVTVE